MDMGNRIHFDRYRQLLEVIKNPYSQWFAVVLPTADNY